MSETNRIEYKREFNTNVDIEKEVIAFLNYHEGGLIYIGINKQGKVLGVSGIDGDMLKIKDRIKNNISPSAMGLFDIVAETKEGKELIKILVAGGTEKPYFKKKFGMTEKGLTLTKRFKQNLELLTEDEKLNYVAYLLGDENGTSIKVAKYSGTDRVDLIENNEYGYCSLIKATKRVLDKLELENKTISRITSKERIDTRLWNAVALREAIINAIIHNDYTREIPPKFEIFSDRLEITSYGGLFEGMTQQDFFDGLSLPRNKELMRVYKDLGMVEQLGSGVPRILQAYSKNCFKFADSYLRLTFPATEQVTTQVTTQVEELIKVFTGEHTRQELQDKLNLSNREHFRKNYLQPALDENLIELTIPEKPNSSKQKYRLTEKGILVKNKH
jgi:ATP-dependent DNA helicase RecG